MAKTYLDQIVDYPTKVMLSIAEDKICTGLILDKAFSEVGEEEIEKAKVKYIKDYLYVDETTQDTAAYVCVEMDVDSVDNKTIKRILLRVTVACHKDYMQLDSQIFGDISGNRRDNIVRNIDRILNNSDFLGLGALKLNSVKTVTPINSFTLREIVYAIPDFNIVGLGK